MLEFFSGEGTRILHVRHAVVMLKKDKSFHSAALYGGQSLGKPDVWWWTLSVVVFVQEIAA